MNSPFKYKNLKQTIQGNSAIQSQNTVVKVKGNSSKQTGQSASYSVQNDDNYSCANHKEYIGKNNNENILGNRNVQITGKSNILHNGKVSKTILGNLSQNYNTNIAEQIGDYVLNHTGDLEQIKNASESNFDGTHQKIYNQKKILEVKNEYTGHHVGNYYKNSKGNDSKNYNGDYNIKVSGNQQYINKGESNSIQDGNRTVNYFNNGKASYNGTSRISDLQLYGEDGKPYHIIVKNGEFVAIR